MAVPASLQVLASEPRPECTTEDGSRVVIEWGYWTSLTMPLDHALEVARYVAERHPAELAEWREEWERNERMLAHQDQLFETPPVPRPGYGQIG